MWQRNVCFTLVGLVLWCSEGEAGQGMAAALPSSWAQRPEVICFYSPFLTLFVLEIKATKGSALLGKGSGRNPSAECGCKAVSMHGKGGEGPPAWQPPPYA